MTRWPIPVSPVLKLALSAAVLGLAWIALAGAGTSADSDLNPVNFVGKVVGLKFGTNITDASGKSYSVPADSPLEAKLFESCRAQELCKIVGAAKRDGTLVKIESAERIPGPTAGQPTAGQKEGGSSAAPVGPSFDCAKAGGEVEHIICGSPRLARLDEDVAAAYKEARARGPDVKRSQVQWLAVRNHCRDEACLLEAYERRLSELKTLVRP